MAVNGETKETDRGYSQIRENLRKAKGSRVDVGLFAEGKHPDSEMTVTEIAAVHEFGSPAAGIPERSFIRSTVDEKKREHRRLARTIFHRILDGDLTAHQGLSLFGELIVGDVKRKLTALKTPPLKASTISAKGGKSKPLIHTGTMRSRIRKRVL